MNEQHYDIEWSRGVTFTTIGVSLICIWVIHLLWRKFPDILTNSLNFYALFLPVLLLIIILFFTALYAPRAIILSDEQLILKRVWGRIVIPIETIAEVHYFSFSSFNIRIFGSGGFMGYYGLFRNKELGKYWCNAGNTKEAFVIVTRTNVKYVFSSSKRTEIVSRLEQLIQK